MNKGDTINGYVLTTPFTTTGGGHCQWAFARRGDKEYFIKRFLKPTYPLPDGPGSEKTKAEKRARCERFARQHTEVKAKLAPLSGPSGNLVVALDFFLHGSRYYKVTAKVDVGAGSMSDIRALRVEDEITLMLKVTSSLGILHKQGLVHGDIKPPNILIEGTATSLNTKLIDFDNCFPVSDPPPPDELVGDLVYYPPEMIEYMVGVGQGSLLTEKADMFALGLTFAEYVNGELPVFPEEYRYPGEAVRHRRRLRLPDGPFHDLLAALLAGDPTTRPGCVEVRDRLQQIRRTVRAGRPVPSSWIDPSAPPTEPVPYVVPEHPGGAGEGTPEEYTAPISGRGATRIRPGVEPTERPTGEPGEAPVAPPEPAPAEAGSPPGLRGKLLDRVARKAPEEAAAAESEELVPAPRLRGRLAKSTSTEPRPGMLKGRLAPPTPAPDETPEPE